MRIKVLNNVYPPAEDSWQTTELLRWVVSNRVGNTTLRIIDVGSGTGVLTLTALEETVSRDNAAWVLSVDHDANASANTKINLIDNGLYQYADVVTMNILDAVRDSSTSISWLVILPTYLVIGMRIGEYLVDLAAMSWLSK